MATIRRDAAIAAGTISAASSTREASIGEAKDAYFGLLATIGRDSQRDATQRDYQFNNFSNGA